MSKWKEMMKDHNDELMWEEEKCQCYNKLLVTKKTSISNVTFSVHSCSCTSSRFFHSSYSTLFTHLLLS